MWTRQIKALLSITIAITLSILLVACNGDDTSLKNSSTQSSADVENSENKINENSQKQDLKNENGNIEMNKHKIPKVEIRVINGSPRMFINGDSVVPEMPFVNSDISSSCFVNMAQVNKAAQYGEIHLQQTNAYVAPLNDKGEYNFDGLRSSLTTVLGGDPDGYVILRLWLGDNTNYNLYDEGDRIKYADGSLGSHISIASDKWLEEAGNILRKTVEYIKNDPEYKSRVVGYILTAAETGEWFQPLFREKGVDVCEANTVKFRQWLKKKYNHDVKALQKAWDNTGVDFDTAQIPVDLLGRGLVQGTNDTLFKVPAQQKAIDYKDYYGDMTTDRILYLAQIAKEASERKSLVGAFYGYSFEIYDAVSGHYALEKVLNSKDIDFLGAPVSYNYRNEGEIGASMSLIDSIHAHGKLWFDECDYRSPIQTEINNFGDGFGPIKTFDALIEVFRRQMGFQMIKGTGGWPMDLFGKGWYDNEDFWKEMGGLTKLYDTYNEIRPQPSPEVALIVDEKSFSLISDAWNVNRPKTYELRHEMYKAGMSFGTYLMSDLENGLVPDAKLYIICEPYRITPDRVDRLIEELHKAGKTVVWMYGFGETSPLDVKRLTGMDIYDTGINRASWIETSDEMKKVFPDYLSKSAGAGGKRSPVWAVRDAGADHDISILGTTDGAVTLAKKDVSGSRQIFFGSYALKADLLRAFAKYAGTHIFNDGWDACMANGNMVVLHTAKAGKRVVSFPEKTDVYEQFGKTWYEDVQSVELNAPIAKTYMFFYGRKQDLQKAGIGK